MDKIRKDDGRDDAKVDLNDPNDVSYSAQQAGISAEEYKKYAKAAGTNGRHAIARYIEEHQKKNHEV